jgi:tetratricopeptide (TPR) repeat protein
MYHLALDVLDQVEDKQGFDYLVCRARVSQMSCDFKEALTSYEHLIDTDPKWLTGYIESAHCYYHQKTFDKALSLYLKAIRIANLTG